MPPPRPRPRLQNRHFLRCSEIFYRETRNQVNSVALNWSQEYAINVWDLCFAWWMNTSIAAAKVLVLHRRIMRKLQENHSTPPRSLVSPKFPCVPQEESWCRGGEQVSWGVGGFPSLKIKEVLVCLLLDFKFSFFQNSQNVQSVKVSKIQKAFNDLWKYGSCITELQVHVF